MLRRLIRPRHSIRARGPYAVARVLPVLLVFALASSACTSRAGPGTDSTTQSGRVTGLRSISELKERFNEDSGSVRLILLVSPT